MATTDPLRQAGPPPQCDRVNVFTGVVLAMEEAANQKDAKQNAFDAAKERASKKDGLPDDRERSAQTNVRAGPAEDTAIPKETMRRDGSLKTTSERSSSALP
jgi:hypothetical protein